MKATFRVMSMVALAGGLGCAGVPKPTEELSQSESAIRSAQELGAGAIPQAALEMKLAFDELQTAKEQMKADHNDKARENLLRCPADAELALALTRQGKADREVQGAQAELRAVQKSVQ
jgi:hypothetical protein